MKKEHSMKKSSELRKAIWIIKDSKGKIIQKCISKNYAEITLNKLNKEGFDKYILERDNQYRKDE